MADVADAPVAPDAAATASSAAAGEAVAADAAPNQTLYINNLNEKLKKSQLKKHLYASFGQFGRILDVSLQRTDALRGQAWVIFADVAAATQALRQMQGFPFFDKPMRLQFATSKSDVVAKAEGSFRAGEKRRRAEGGDKPVKRKAARMEAAPAAARMPVVTEPNHILLVQGLTPEVTADTLRALFGQYAGLKDVRLIAERGLAFVEYEHEALATPALQGLFNHRISATSTMQVSYARK